MRDPDAFLVSRLRFRHLSVIEALHSLRSIRKAARVLHLSEPAVSKALREIEASFGFRLFERSAAGVLPTPQGQAVVEGATLLLNSLRHVRRAAQAAGGGLLLRLGAIPFLGVTLLPQLLHSLQRDDPQLRVELSEGSSPQLLSRLRDGEIDVLLTTLSTDLLSPEGAIGVAFQPLFTEQLAVLAPPGHRLARRRKVDLAELVDEPWILPPGPTVTTVAMRDVFLARGLQPPVPWIESSGVHASLEFTAAGLGLCAAPMALARAAKRRGLVAELKVDQPIGLPAVCFIHRVADAASPSVRVLQRALEKAGLLASKGP